MRTLFLISLFSITVCAFAKESPPNIVFIFSDDHAWQALSSYGDSRELVETPNLDRLAESGMRFDRCLVTNSICGPSRATVLTGKYSHLNGVYNNSGNTPFDGSQVTFPKLLQKSGYETAIVGKWHLESDPTGFDYWQILPGQGTYYNPEMITEDGTERLEGYVTDIITDLSIDWLEKRDPSKPFLLMSQHKAAHRAWQPALRHLDPGVEPSLFAEPATLYDRHEMQGPAIRDQAMSIQHHFKDGDVKLKIGDPVELDEAQRKQWDDYYTPLNDAFQINRHPSADEVLRWRYQRYMHDYTKCITALDENVGRLLDYLEEEGLMENTIIVYSSDQGFFLGEHGWFDKRWFFEESLRTPLLVQWSGVTPAGSSSSSLVSTLDFAQTLLDVAGVDAPREMQGRSLVPLLRGEQPSDWRKSFYYHYYEYPRPHRVAPHYAVITERYKLVKFYGTQQDYTELYDLKRDPHEIAPVTRLSGYSEVIDELESQLSRLRTELDVPNEQDPRAAGWGADDWEKLYHNRYSPRARME